MLGSRRSDDFAPRLQSLVCLLALRHRIEVAQRAVLLIATCRAYGRRHRRARLRLPANPGAAIGHAGRSNPFFDSIDLRRTASSASGIIGFVQQTLRLLHGSLAHFMSSHSFDISKSIADRALAAAPEG
jgi:hypothetical protein